MALSRTLSQVGNPYGIDVEKLVAMSPEGRCDALLSYTPVMRAKILDKLPEEVEHQATTPPATAPPAKPA